MKEIWYYMHYTTRYAVRDNKWVMSIVGFKYF